MTALPVSLAIGYTSAVQVGDAVKVGQKIASKENKSEEIINLPEQLSVSLRKARKLILKNPGDSVKSGDILATKKGFLGFSKVSVISKVSGIVLRYERESGNLIIKIPTNASPVEIISPVDGTVSLCDNKQIVINTDKNVLSGNKSTGESVEGEILVLKADDPYFLDANSIDKIVIGKKLTRELILKGIGIGVKGLIGSDISDGDIGYLKSKNFKTAMMEFSESDIQQIVGWSGKKVFLDPKSKSIIFLAL